MFYCVSYLISSTGIVLSRYFFICIVFAIEIQHLLLFLSVLRFSLSLCAAGIPSVSVYRYFEKMEHKTKRRNATSQSALRRTAKATRK